MICARGLSFAVFVALGSCQYSSLHLPYSINYEKDVLQNPSREEIYEKFFLTLSYAAEENEFNTTDGVPLEFLLLLQRISYDFAGVRDTFETGITNMETCATCRSLLGLLSNVKRVVSRSVFFRGLSFTCQWFKLNTPGVCAGLIEKYQDEIDFIMDEAGKRQISAEESCTLVFGSPCGSLDSEYHIWDMNVTERTNSTPTFSSLAILDQNRAEPGDSYGILHISDTHFDPEYEVGSLANCTEPLCCQKASGEPTGPDSQAKAWGDYRRCDLPQKTLENMLQHIQSNMSDQVEFAYWTGDLPAHDLWKLTEESNELNFNLTSELLKSYLGQLRNGQFKIFATVGNHESIPPNMFTRTTEPKSGEPDPKFLKKTEKLYDFLWDSWKQWLPAEAESTFRKYGYYSARPRQGLKVISLNTNYCYYFNFWLLLDSRDAADQLAWLDRELFESEEAGEAVHIIGHVPPGLADCIETWSKEFHSIVDSSKIATALEPREINLNALGNFGPPPEQQIVELRGQYPVGYRDTIKAQFYGHTHYDEFVVYFDEETRAVPINIAYIGPSVTTYSFLNPSFRVYRSDQRNHRIEDHETYILNLTDANLNDRGVWFKEYSARADLKLAGLTPADWNNYVDRMAQQPQEFEAFYTRFLHSSDQDFPCDQRCARRQLCRMKTDMAHDYRPCGTNSSGLLDSIMNMNVTSLGIDDMISSNSTADTRDRHPGVLWTMIGYLQQSVASYFPSFYMAHNNPLQRTALREL